MEVRHLQPRRFSAAVEDLHRRLLSSAHVLFFRDGHLRYRQENKWFDDTGGYLRGGHGSELGSGISFRDRRQSSLWHLQRRLFRAAVGHLQRRLFSNDHWLYHRSDHLQCRHDNTRDDNVVCVRECRPLRRFLWQSFTVDGDRHIAMFAVM